MKSATSNRPVIGILEWFHQGDTAHVEKALAQLQQLGITELRTGISWADYHTPDGKKWLEWLIPKLSEHVRVLPCLLYTPPSIGLEPKTSSPPRYPEYYADFTDKILQQFGQYFEWVELWNEPNNTSEYDFTLDPEYKIFGKMIKWAAREVHEHGKKVLLGGMSPIDPYWLNFMYECEVMDCVDAVGIHGFPGTFDGQWMGWAAQLKKLHEIMEYQQSPREIWITETGFSTWQHDERRQLEVFLEAMQAPVSRVYWYCLNDLDAHRATVDGFHTDEREYYFGLVKQNGAPKLLYRLLRQHGPGHIEKAAWLAAPPVVKRERQHVLITGGAGFLGTNLADELLQSGKRVTIYDNLSRPGVEKNLKWLKKQHGERVNVHMADVRNRFQLQQAVNAAEAVYHYAAQVAVTTSCQDPVSDFYINAEGTLNLLEAIRSTPHQPPLVFTSTNKVYGNLDQVKLHETATRYERVMDNGHGHGIGEGRGLDFYSPYGCSKGTADAYVLDYARTFGLQATVFRMSCIYGPHQFGTEDQGWVAHFLIQALKDRPLTLFGDGKQVRDILFVEDLVAAMKLAMKHIDKTSGQAFNIGGGYANSISLLELIKIIEELQGRPLQWQHEGWRPGDQKYYVSDTSRFKDITGWQPRHSIRQGIAQLYNWLQHAGPMAEQVVV